MEALGLSDEGANSGESVNSTIYTEETMRQMEKLVLIRKAMLVRYFKIEYTRVGEECMRLRIRRVSFLDRREHEIAGCLGKYIPVRRHAPLPPTYVQNLEKRWNWVM